ncbi:MAG: S-layer homology domain-containing protein [Tepidanaerobacteraceae bacterium]|jgi:hypothetical protein|nr:S-layer homology domain-containing protein [Tepidanaerobacteraceae bacterium]
MAISIINEMVYKPTLKKLRRENAFVAFDEAAGVYKIHNVLLDFLRGKQKDEEERAALYRRLGEWHLARGEYRTVYGYLCRPGETERVLALLDNEDTVASDSAAFDGVSDPGVSSYSLGIPAACLTTPGGGSLTFSTGAGSVTIPSGMLAGMPGTEGKQAGITIARGDKTGLPEEVKAAVGDRPIIQLTLTLDGAQTEWNNPDAPVTVSIPYTPTVAELADPEHIVIWYIDSSGNVFSVPNGRYDPAAGTVTFTTTHFSHYAVAYVHKTFNDLGGVEWARKPVEVMASKGIISGTSKNTFSPAANITRADYLEGEFRQSALLQQAKHTLTYGSGDYSPEKGSILRRMRNSV